MKIKLLFVPNTMVSHLIPLLSLAKTLDKEKFEFSFLLPGEFHSFVKSFGFNVLDIKRDYKNGAVQEIFALQKYKPHIVVDDLSFYTAYSSRYLKIPRISIVRTGILPSENKAGFDKHSSHVEFFFEELNRLNANQKLNWKPREAADLFIGDINLIPSIPSIEMLPEELKNNSQYRHVGPLILSDEDLMERIAYVDGNGLQYKDNRKPVEDFLRLHKNRKIVYFTKGITNVAGLLDVGEELIKKMINKNIAVITNIPGYKIESPLLYSDLFLPMHTICSSVHAMVHHGGSGTYNYQVKYELPAIILGNRCYDRDLVAMRLNKIGASAFIPADLSNESIYNSFETVFETMIDPQSAEYRSQKSALAGLSKELHQTESNFDFGKTASELFYNHNR